MHWLEHRIPPPLVALATGALMWSLAGIAPAVDFRFKGHVIAAAAIGLAGVLINLAGFMEFRRARTTVNPMKPETASALVRSGIFRHTRNPMYLGLALLLLGFGIWLANLLSLLVVPAFLSYVRRFQIVPEERAMRSLFGAEFTAYEKAVRRWL